MIGKVPDLILFLDDLFPASLWNWFANWFNQF